MVDVEADGPIPGDYSMVSFGAVVVEPSMEHTFYGECCPISDKFVQEALDVCKVSREATLAFPKAELTMLKFKQWVNDVCESRPLFISDNNGFDWQFINWYFHHFTGSNPFGFSSKNLGSMYQGMMKNCFKSFKHLRKTKHTHHPVDDAKGNVEALLQMIDMGLIIK